jgi:hypothetical protein
MKRESIPQGFPICAAFIFAILLLVSCATTPKIQSPPPEELRVHLGRIGIVSASFQPEVRFRKPLTKGTGLLHGAGIGALAGADIMRGCTGMACGGIFIALPLGAIVGSVIGAVRGVSPEKIKESEDALNEYLATLNFQETVRERFLSAATEQTQYPLVLLGVQGPNALDEDVIYDCMSEKDIDTIIEISVRKCDLYVAKGHINPILGLLLAVGTRFIRIEDGKVLYNRNFVYDYMGNYRTYSEWAVDNAQPLKEELDRAFSYLAMKIVGELINIQAPLNSDSSDVMKN